MSSDDNSLFYRMLHSHNSGPIGEAAKRIAALQAIKEQGGAFVNSVKRGPDDLPLTDGDKKFLYDLRIKA